MNREIDTSQLHRPAQLFPLIRQLSFRISPVLAKSGLSPNLVTLIGLAAGLSSALLFSLGDRGPGLVGAVLWLVCNLMDYCDGEVARLTHRSSRLGKVLDEVTDWAVHTAFFLGLGVGVQTATGESLWLWLGAACSMGTTLNSILAGVRVWLRKQRGEREPRVPGAPQRPKGAKEQLIYFFRELSRADFWLLVLALEVFHATWVLLPAAAIGIQVYWLS